MMTHVDTHTPTPKGENITSQHCHDRQKSCRYFSNKQVCCEVMSSLKNPNNWMAFHDISDYPSLFTDIHDP